MLDVLFEVAAADGQVVDSERAEILQVATELGLTSDEVAASRRPAVAG